MVVPFNEPHEPLSSYRFRDGRVGGMKLIRAESSIIVQSCSTSTRMVSRTIIGKHDSHVGRDTARGLIEAGEYVSHTSEVICRYQWRKRLREGSSLETFRFPSRSLFARQVYTNSRNYLSDCVRRSKIEQEMLDNDCSLSLSLARSLALSLKI